MADQFVSGLWLEGKDLFSINHRELLAVERGLFQLRWCLKGHVVAVFSNNTTAVAYLRHQGGTLSSTLNSVAQQILHWAEREGISICPHFVPGKNIVVANALSHPNQVVGTEWTLHQEVSDSLRKRCASLNRCFCILSKSPLWCVLCSGLGPHGYGDGRHAAVVGPFAVVCVPSIHDDTPGLVKTPGVLRSVNHSYSSVLAAEGVVPGPSGTSPGTSSPSAGEVEPPAATSRLLVSSTSIRASTSCVETIRRFARASGLSARMARRLGSSRRASSIASYQCKWSLYRRWCWEKGHSVSNLSVAKVADYLLWLWESKGLSLSSVKAHRSMLSTVFRFKLPELSEHHALRDLFRSFAVERPRVPLIPPSWDLDIVLKHLMSSAYESWGVSCCGP